MTGPLATRAAKRVASQARAAVRASLQSSITGYPTGSGSIEGGKIWQQHVRYLNVHKYQGARLMRKVGVNAPKGVVVSSAKDVAEAIRKNFPDEKELVVKIQVLVGGRGLGTFKNGLEGGVHIVKTSEVESLTEKMLGQTKQTGVEGKPVNELFPCEKMNLVNKMYFAIDLDRVSAGPVIIACRKGGTSIEDLAKKYPDMIVKVPVDINKGITDAEAAQVVEGLAPIKAQHKDCIEQVNKIYSLFTKSNCTLVEINPLAEIVDGVMVAVDAKLNFDDNAAYGQKEIFALRDKTLEDPCEVVATAADLNYIGLDGEIGCMVNGVGLAMAMMDIIKMHGGTPTNFLDVGSNASEQRVVEAFRILTLDTKVKAILVNIFGGIMKCDVIAGGIVNFAKQVSLKVPLNMRLEGTNVDLGMTILKESGMMIITTEDLGDAAEKVVKSLS